VPFCQTVSYKLLRILSMGWGARLDQIEVEKPDQRQELNKTIMDESYKGCVVIKGKKGQKKLHVQVLMAMYGRLILARLLLQQKACSRFEGVQLCVANRMVGGHQLTVLWHMQMIFKISHKILKDG
jgi:hypothetical protein